MIYLDYAATTPVFGELNSIIHQYNTLNFFNPSALYAPHALKSQIRAAKQVIADKLGAGHEEIVLTSGATESNNLALAGIMQKSRGALVISGGEHPSVYNAAINLRDAGKEVIILPVKANGTADIDALKELIALRGDSIGMVSIVHVSNEIGAINDIAAISRIIKSNNPKIIFHSDGVQAFCKTDTRNLGVDLYSISGHKFGAPKGVGALYVRRNTNLNPLAIGGGQEGGLRSGTENISGLMAMAKAAQLCAQQFDIAHIASLKERLIAQITQELPETLINSYDIHSTMPHIVSISLPKINAETLMNILKSQNIYVGLGSACSANSKGNRILDELGYSKERVKGTVRISMGWDTEPGHIEIAARAIIKAAKELYKHVGR